MLPPGDDRPVFPHEARDAAARESRAACRAPHLPSRACSRALLPSRARHRAASGARQAQHKYVLFNSIQLTGHSRGGNMADLFGRTLGLRSIAQNPATWGKVFKEQEPAVESITARSADVISLLESFSTHDRKVGTAPRPQHAHAGT